MRNNLGTGGERMNGMDYRCVQCGVTVTIPSEKEGTVTCTSCGFAYRYGENYLKYEFDKLLFQQFKKKYLLYKTLHNNACLAYYTIQEGSLSLSQRDDVRNFKNYILSQIDRGKILDVGCGILDWPGYLNFKEKEGFEFYGIDPIDNRNFRGVRVTGCAEFMPFQDRFFDALIFATSLDHMCSLEETISESYRVLSKGGKLIVWTADPYISLNERVKTKVLGWIRKLRKPSLPWIDVFHLAPGTNIRVDRFVIYPNFYVFHIPKGAVDPFHVSYESPQRIVALMKKAKFVLLDRQYNHKNEVFLCFRKDN